MNAIDQAKAVVRSHEEFSAAGNVEGVISNMAPDVVMVAPNTPLVEGIEAIRAVYQAFFSAGTWEFTHEYAGAEDLGDFVILHGISRGSLTPKEGVADTFANNFLLTLKRDEQGVFRFWRGAFAPSGE